MATWANSYPSRAPLCGPAPVSWKPAPSACPLPAEPRPNFHVEMHELARGGLYDADDLSGGAVQVVQAIESQPPQHGVDRRTRDAELPADAMRPPGPLPAQPAHRGDLPGCKLGVGHVGTRRAVGEPGFSLVLKSDEPLVDRGA